MKQLKCFLLTWNHTQVVEIHEGATLPSYLHYCLMTKVTFLCSKLSLLRWYQQQVNWEQTEDEITPQFTLQNYNK